LLRRITTILCVLAVAATATGSAYAKDHVILQRSSPRGTGSVFVVAGLVPAHRYRIDVSAPAHIKFSALGIEDYNGIYKKSLFQSSKPVKFQGTTPRSYVIVQPIKQTLSGWTIALNVTNPKRKVLTVRLVDLGRQK